ncbi:MAG TPA: cytidylate kinase-like family protein [Candidatus Binatia bacterium]|nr:cytidylate kinase-like family protein [Candidatus Binatia bacterium]
MIVSISRELGAGGGTVGEAVAAALGAKLLDERAMLDELARRLRFSPDALEQSVERPPTLGETLIANLARSAAMMEGTEVYQTREEEVIETVRSIVLDYAEHGDVVVIGHGGISLLGWRPATPVVLSILLKAGQQWRIEQLARRFSIDIEEARRRIKRTDEARVAYQKHFFRTNIYDVKQYDLVIDTERLGLDLTISLATSAVRRLTAV